MLLIANMSAFYPRERMIQKTGTAYWAGAAGGLASARRRLLFDLGEVLLDYVAIGLKPIGCLDELAALHGPDLKPSAAFMILGRHLHRRRHASKGKVLHLFHAVLHIFGRWHAAFLGFYRVAKSLDLHGRPHNTAIVVNRRIELLRRGLALC